jgi:hypothetical protein
MDESTGGGTVSVSGAGGGLNFCIFGGLLYLLGFVLQNNLKTKKKFNETTQHAQHTRQRIRENNEI